MFKNLEEVLLYLGEKTELFVPIGDEILRLKEENIKLKKAMDDLVILSLGGI